MKKLSQRNKRVINVLNEKIASLHRLAGHKDNEFKKEIYISVADGLRTCIYLLTDNEYLNALEKLYNMMEESK